MSTHGIFQSQDFSPPEEKFQPSTAVRRAAEQSRQKTTENRLHLLHLTGFPQVFDNHSSPAEQLRLHNIADQFSRSQLLDKLQNASPRQTSTAGGSPRRTNTNGKNYPSMRTTNQVFDDAMQQATCQFRLLSPRREAAEQDKHQDRQRDPEYEEMLQARKMPFDCVVRSARGLITTIYREDFCKNPPQESFRTQTLPREEAAPVGSPKETNLVEIPNQHTAVADSAGAVERRELGLPEPKKKTYVNRVAAVSPRKTTVYTASPRRHIPPPVLNGEYVAVTRSYFTERGEHLRDLPPSTQTNVPW